MRRRRLPTADDPPVQISAATARTALAILREFQRQHPPTADVGAAECELAMLLP